MTKCKDVHLQTINIIYLIISCLFAASGQILLKTGAHNSVNPIDFINLWIISGLLSYVASTVFWVYVLSVENLTKVFPFTMLTFIIIYVFSIFVLKEHIQFKGYMGIVLILSGLYLVSK